MASDLHSFVFPELKPKDLALPVQGARASVVLVLAVFLLVGVAAARIVSTYHVFSQTADEPAHLAAGMEWLQWHTYTFEPLHPPLARIAVAIGPYMSGLRLLDHRNLWIEGNELLLAHDDYIHNLSLARAGVLPFFLLASLVVWYWARRQYGDVAALIATFLFTTSPVVLSHAGLATTDMAATATFAAAIFAYITFLERPNYLQAAAFGGAAALAILSKFSALVFLPACCATILLTRFVMTRRTPGHFTKRRRRARWAQFLLVAGVITFVVVWGGYRFSLSSATDASSRPHYSIDQLFGTSGALHNTVYAMAELPFIPAPAFSQGLVKLRFKESVGHKSYLLGHVRQTGWWYFFPTALAVKSTVPFLIFLIAGAFALIKSALLFERDWRAVTPLVAALTVLVICMPSNINIGIRHILPIYPMLAIISGVGAWWLWENAQAMSVGPIIVVALLIWQLLASVRSHPDYLAYFNEFAGAHPENILIGSDLDWGQDLLRLAQAIQQKHIDHLAIAYAGSSHIDLSKFGLPAFQVLEPYKPVTGWIAISLLDLKVGDLGAPADGFYWLEAYEPVDLIGRSIRLYYIPNLPQPPGGSTF
jgi:hypothetical protein